MNRITRALALLLAVCMIAAGTAVAANPNEGFAFHINVSQTQVDVGGQIEVSISLAPGQDVTGFGSAQIYVSWDPTVFSVSKLSGQSGFKASVGKQNDYVFANKYTSSYTTDVSWQQEAGVAQFTLTALTNGKCELRLYDAQIVDRSFNMIPTDSGSVVTLYAGEVTPQAQETSQTPKTTRKTSEQLFPAENQLPRFEDVPTTHWAFDAVDFCTALGLFTGTSATKFSPDGAMTRGMFMTVLARFHLVDTADSSPWYAKGVEWAVQSGISDGSNPNASLSREQLVTMLYRCTEQPGQGASIDSYPDAGAVSSYALEAMQWAVGRGILNGINGKLSPQSGATRAQLAVILMRWCQNEM